MKIPYNIGENCITAILNDELHTIRSEHANFEVVKDALEAGDHETAIRKISRINEVKEFVEDKLEVKDGGVYYDGQEIHGTVIDKLLQMIEDGVQDVMPLLNFINRLMANPSNNSVNQLYNFLNMKGLPITPEGLVIAYKGVSSDLYSVMGNTSTKVLQGVTDSGGHILNEIGATIEVARRDVDDDKHRSCSYGLHLGSHNYACGWGTKTLLCEFDPADAVSVPEEGRFDKLRVCKYRVISDISEGPKELKDSVYIEEKEAEIDEADEACETCDGSCQNTVSEASPLIDTYINNKINEGVSPSLKQIQSRMKGYPLSVKDIESIATSLGYSIIKAAPNANSRNTFVSPKI